jgi:hypothetical protein
MKTTATKSLLILVGLLLASCAVDDGMPDFERMSDEELAAYNKGRNLSQMIVCNEDTSTMSRVRRKRCATIEAMYGTRLSVEQINILSARVGLQQ